MFRAHASIRLGLTIISECPNSALYPFRACTFARLIFLVCVARHLVHADGLGPRLFPRIPLPFSSRAHPSVNTTWKACIASGFLRFHTIRVGLAILMRGVGTALPLFSCRMTENLAYEKGKRSCGETTTMPPRGKYDWDLYLDRITRSEDQIRVLAYSRF